MPQGAKTLLFRGSEVVWFWRYTVTCRDVQAIQTGGWVLKVVEWFLREPPVLTVPDSVNVKGGLGAAVKCVGGRDLGLRAFWEAVWLSLKFVGLQTIKKTKGQRSSLGQLWCQHPWVHRGLLLATITFKSEQRKTCNSSSSSSLPLLFILWLLFPSTPASLFLPYLLPLPLALPFLKPLWTNFNDNVWKREWWTGLSISENSLRTDKV